MPILEFASRGAALAAAVTGVVESLAQALAGRGRASLGVCGGRTAAAMLPVLATQLIDWEYVDVFLVDERWVDPSDDQSNEKLVRATLLQGPAAVARFTGLKSTHHSARQAAPNIEPVEELDLAALEIDPATVGWAGARQEITEIVDAPAREAGEVIVDEGEAHERIMAFLDDLKVL